MYILEQDNTALYAYVIYISRNKTLLGNRILETLQHTNMHLSKTLSINKA